ncbi:hypothetical protein GCM10007301_37410 [Azorhizobium oxalatiphilum]|uniref:Phosphatidic acid phosphatase type 2/haloperoxidase domain-containing protein n=1 Tax=Azorhizobium oxalatiphilum TaxID=980631 RepID=A0A917C678_9HYPH|nr:phosphatase PAP2 family protein [Azorhizobium oxalatiphilum]GGF74118.1 hypothetical protein GCM10007301_37410 [Azorhizobium oxalatiphilum]
MSDAAATPPASRPAWVEDVRAAVAGLFTALKVLRTRKPRGPAPRLPMDGLVEMVCLFMLVGGVVAATMILIDPLIPGLRLMLPLGVIHFFERVTELGLGGTVLWPLGIALLVLLGAVPHLDLLYRRVAAAVVARVGFVFLSVAATSLAVLVVKYILGRARPYEVLHLPGPNAHLTFELFRLQASYSSFPSGHSTVVFAFAVSAALLFPKARWWLIALAVLVAASRVVLGSHFPSDVIAAAAIATASSFWLAKVFAARGLVFSIAADGRLHPMPGPSMRRLMALFSPAHRLSGASSASQEARP